MACQPVVSYLLKFVLTQMHISIQMEKNQTILKDVMILFLVLDATGPTFKEGLIKPSPRLSRFPSSLILITEGERSSGLRKHPVWQC